MQFLKTEEREVSTNFSNTFSHNVQVTLSSMKEPGFYFSQHFKHQLEHYFKISGDNGQIQRNSHEAPARACGSTQTVHSPKH